MTKNNINVNDKKFSDSINPIDEHFKKYMIDYILPNAVAFYLKECNSNHCLSDDSFYNHVKSSLKMLCNYHDSIDTLMSMVVKELFINYNIEITNYDQLEFKIVNK